MITHNSTLHFEIVTDDYQMVSVSMNISTWKINETHYIVGNVNTVSNTVEIYCDGILKSRLKYRFLRISSEFILEKNITLGASLEHHFPCPFIVEHFSCGDSLSKEIIKSVSKIF